MQPIRDFLTSQDRKALRAILHRSGHSAQEHGRANAILLLDEGVPLPLVAKILFLDEDTIRNFLARYQSGQLSGLLDDKRHGKASKLSDSQKEQLQRHIEANLYTDSSLVAAYVSIEFGVAYSKSGIKRLLHEMDFVYKMPKHVPGKSDREAQAEFVKRFKEMMATKSAGTPVYFSDAVHPTHNSAPAYGWIRRGTDKELVANSGRQRINLHGALNAETNEVIVQRAVTINSEATIELLKAIDARHPDAPCIHVIVDNAGYYHGSLVSEYLASGASRIQLWFLPPYSPNLNLIERLWKFFRKKVMNNRYYPTFKEFTEEALMFFECLSEYADELRTLLTHNFHLYTDNPEKWVTIAY